MIDKTLMNAINENNKKEYQKWVKNQKRRRTIDTICVISMVLAILGLIIVFGSIVNHQSEKAVKKCVKMGYTIDYCTRDK